MVFGAVLNKSGVMVGLHATQPELKTHERMGSPKRCNAAATWCEDRSDKGESLEMPQRDQEGSWPVRRDLSSERLS